MTINFVSRKGRRTAGFPVIYYIVGYFFYLHEMATVDNEEKAPHFVYVSPSFGIDVEEAIHVIAALYLIR